MSASRVLPSLLAAALFVWFFTTQERRLSPARTLHQLQESGGVVLLERGWSATLTSCDEATETCIQVHKTESELKLPDANATARMVRTASAQPTHLTLSRVFSSQEVKWLVAAQSPMLVIPRGPLEEVVSSQIMVKADGESTLVRPQPQLLADWRTGVVPLELKFRIKGQKWFGPADIPIALATRGAVTTYAKITDLQWMSDLINRTLIIASALLVCMFSTLIFENALLRLLSWFALGDALRTFLSISEAGNLGWQSWAMQLVNVFVVVVYLAIAFELMKIRVPKPVFPTLFATLGSLSILTAALFPSWFLLADLVGELTGAVGAMVAIVVFQTQTLWRARRSRPKNMCSSQKEELPRFFALPTHYQYLRLALFLFGFAVSAWVNLDGLLRLQTDYFRDALAWQNIFSLPIITAGVLVEVAFFSKKQEAAERELAKKAELEREIGLGKALLKKMLPKRKWSSDGVSWRILYTPASQIAGDWCDVRLIEIPGFDRAKSRSMIFSCVVDVAGHGLQAGVNTTVVSAVIGSWIDELVSKNANPSGVDLALKLSELARDMANAFIAMHEATAATGVFALLDPITRELIYLTAAHPAPIVMTKGSMRFLSQSNGGMLGVKGAAGIEQFNAMQARLDVDELLLLVSDGLLNGEPRATFQRKVMRRFRERSLPIVRHIWMVAREQKKRWRIEPQNQEDDMTAVVVGLNLI